MPGEPFGGKPDAANRHGEHRNNLTDKEFCGCHEGRSRCATGVVRNPIFDNARLPPSSGILRHLRQAASDLSEMRRSLCVAMCGCGDYAASGMRHWWRITQTSH
jgi:hypothetical protein